MFYSLKECRKGGYAYYDSKVEITDVDGVITFTFIAEHSDYFCPRKGYNQHHCVGDACEILIGSDPERRFYYEIEISPRNDLMIALSENRGVREDGKLDLITNHWENCFVKSEVTLRDGGYVAKVWFDKKDIMSGDGEIYFNAYRLETDGGYMEKHLFALSPTLQGRFHVPDKFVYLKDYANK